MREAEEAFAREVRRLQGPTEETQSYQSASSGAGVGVGIGQTMGVPQPMGGGRNRPPSWNGRHAVSATWDSCSCASGISFDRGFANLGTTQAPCSWGRRGISPIRRLAHSSVSTDERCVRICQRMVGTNGPSRGEPLFASPLEKLRMRPTPPVHLEANPRLEQRAVTMLLSALPESLTTTGILFRLYTSYQPGGLGERTGLIRSISEVKVPAGLVELLGSIRQWRRSL
jgi:hypothetical protein